MHNGPAAAGHHGRAASPLAAVLAQEWRACDCAPGLGGMSDMRAILHPAPRVLRGVLCRRFPLLGCVLLLGAAGCGTIAGSGANAAAQRQARADANYAKALAHYAEGLLLETERGHAADAQRAFEAACRFDPDSHRPIAALTLRLLQEGRTREAIDRLEAYCRDHPDDVAVRCDLARLAESHDDAGRAARYYAEAFRLRPDDLSLAFAHVRALFEDARDTDAVREMRTLNREHPCADTRNLPTFWAIQFYRHEHAAARALPCLDLACELATGATQRVELRLFTGEAARTAGNTNAAVRAFRQTLALQPLHIRAALGLAGVLYARDGTAAIAAQAQRIQNAPADVPELLTLAALHLAAQDRTNAAPVLARARDAMRAQQTIPTVEFDLLQGSTLDEMGRQDAAAEVFEESLRQHPHADIVMNYMAYMWAVANVRLDEAAGMAQQAVKRHPRNGAYIDTLAWVRYRQQRFADALDLLLRARERMRDDPTVLEHLGDVLDQLKRTPEAIAYWSRSYAVDPTQAAVAAKLLGAGIDPASIPRIEPQAETDESDEDVDTE